MGSFYRIITSNGLLSIGYKNDHKDIHLHSFYAPDIEAERFIGSKKDELDEKEIILVYGIGLGYHLKELEKYLKKQHQVHVIEMNTDLLDYLDEGIFSLSEFRKKGYQFCISDNLETVNNYLLNILTHNDIYNISFIIHRPSLKIIPENCNPIESLLEELEIKRDSFNRFRDLMRTNFYDNIKNINNYYTFDFNFSGLRNKPFIIIASGPSLDKNKDLLWYFKGKVITIAVGSALKPLINSGFYPDCFIITDPQPAVYNQIKGIELNIPMLFFPTVSPEVINSYKGKKVILFQKGYNLSEEYARKMAVKTIATGGSVTTSALEVALQSGANPVIFTGLDLAYTDGVSHAEGTSHQNDLPNPQGVRVKGIDGKNLITGRNLYIYLRYIENRIRQADGVRFIDSTEGGAFIQGTEVRPLEEVLRILEEQKEEVKFPEECLIKKW